MQSDQDSKHILANIRDQIGKPLRDGFDWNEYASKDAIRHFARGIGDLNSLWVNENYAKKSKYGTILAPPMFLYSVDGTTRPPLLTDSQTGLYFPTPPLGGRTENARGMYGGCRWEWYDVMKRDDRFSAQNSLHSVEEKVGRSGNSMVLMTFQTIYKNQHDKIVAKAYGTVLSFPPGMVRYEARKEHTYTHDELAKIRDDILKEEVRGASPRYWEDVQEGDTITPVVKGPLTLTDYVGWEAGRGAFFGSLEPAKIYRPVEEWFDSENSHEDRELGEERGFGGPNIDGPCLVSWHGHLMTNWMGDDGFLSVCDVKLVKPVLHGDTIWVTGKVSRKYVENGTHKVECELQSMNQDKVITATARAVVDLPSRG